ncbi:MAG: signal peptidase I [Bacillota bacterium]|nr:signal peptidase I [Bacillota bacterium]
MSELVASRNKRKKTALLVILISFLSIVVIGIGLGFLFYVHSFERAIINGSSMSPTLNSGDQVLFKKNAGIKRGDIVLFDITNIKSDTTGLLVKRVIAVENDRVEIKDGFVYVNGKKLDEDYISGKQTEIIYEKYNNLVVPKGTVYILGDNRQPAGSIDSRVLGPIDLKRIKGRMALKLF